MNVRRLAAAAAAAACLPAVSAVQLGPIGPAQTSPAELQDIPFDINPPTITPAPVAPRAILQKRDTATCGYVDGDGANGYVCANSAARCLYNDQASAVGCCLTTSCNIYTACLDYASSSATKTFNADRTRFCSNSALPYCAYYKYDENESSLAGYTIPTCDSTRGSYIIFLTSTSASATATGSSSESSSSSTSESSSASSTESPSATGTEADGLPAETSSTATATPEPSSGAPIGAIVGGVIGGIAALALIGLGVFFLMRRNSKNNRHNSPPTTAVGTVPPSFPGGPPGGPYQQLPTQASPQPHMSVMGDPAALDPRYNNGLHSPHSPHMSISPQGTPSPAPFGQQQYAQGLGVGPMGTPPPQHQGLGTPPPQGYGAPPSPGHSVGGYAPYGAPSPMHQQQYGQGPYGAPQQQMPQQHHAVELPTQKGDGQVYEMS
ncbi:hypothetical protein B0J18DRAFT_469916 [Chaetomium sp. MPI-SDFR-AT-0129]|nr:hypothetical protein B0J18DRAFT_469916 [Chaetomium sp. MPI-SDFR-AT-0129]